MVSVCFVSLCRVAIGSSAFTVHFACCLWTKEKEREEGSGKRGREKRVSRLHSGCAFPIRKVFLTRPVLIFFSSSMVII